MSTNLNRIAFRSAGSHQHHIDMLIAETEAVADHLWPPFLDGEDLALIEIYPGQEFGPSYATWKASEAPLTDLPLTDDMRQDILDHTKNVKGEEAWPIIILEHRGENTLVSFVVLDVYSRPASN